MSKRMCVVFVVALLAVFTMFGASSEAATMKFDHFSIDVPAGWKVTEDKENHTVGFVAPDESAAITVSVFDGEGASVQEIAEVLREAMGGAALSKVDEDTYSFQFKNSSGVAGNAFVSIDDGKIAFLTITGEHADIEKMINSLQDN